MNGYKIEGKKYNSFFIGSCNFIEMVFHRMDKTGRTYTITFYECFMSKYDFTLHLYIEPVLSVIISNQCRKHAYFLIEICCCCCCCCQWYWCSRFWSCIQFHFGLISKGIEGTVKRVLFHDANGKMFFFFSHKSRVQINDILAWFDCWHFDRNIFRCSFLNDCICDSIKLNK